MSSNFELPKNIERYLTQAEFESVQTDAEELCRILAKIKTSTRETIRNS